MNAIVKFLTYFLGAIAFFMTILLALGIIVRLIQALFAII